jgi:hypothetical protein
MLRKACLDLAVKVHYTQKKESCPRKKEWRPKPTKADGTSSTGTNMVFILPPEFSQKKESHPRKKEWRPKPTKADGTASAGTNMVFILPPEFYAPDRKELPVAQLDFGPWPVILRSPGRRIISI